MTGKTLNINGKEYTLKFTINTMCAMEGAGIDVMNLDAIYFNMPIIRKFFYYALKSTNVKMTENKAGELMDQYIGEGHDISDILDVIMETLAESLGSKENIEADEDVDEGK